MCTRKVYSEFTYNKNSAAARGTKNTMCFFETSVYIFFKIQCLKSDIIARRAMQNYTFVSSGQKRPNTTKGPSLWQKTVWRYFTLKSAWCIKSAQHIRVICKTDGSQREQSILDARAYYRLYRKEVFTFAKIGRLSHLSLSLGKNVKTAKFFLRARCPFRVILPRIIGAQKSPARGLRSIISAIAVWLGASLSLSLLYDSRLVKFSVARSLAPILRYTSLLLPLSFYIFYLALFILLTALYINFLWSKF